MPRARVDGEIARKATTIRRHTDLEVYRLAFQTAMHVFELCKSFPQEELYSLTDQIRRASRSVCANIAEGWRKRRYAAAFINKLSECEAEAAEPQVWIQFAVKCGYWSDAPARELYRKYDSVIGMLVEMARKPEKWTL